MPYKNKEKQKEYMKKYLEEYMKGYMEQWLQKNPEYHKEYHKIWAKNNHKKTRIIYNHWYNKKFRISLKLKLDKSINCIIRNSLKNNGKERHWKKLLGYDLDKLKKHLQKTIPNDYCWKDYIDGKLEIDHIIPISAFNYTRPEHIDFKRCWALDNLRLLPAIENKIKKDKLTRPFQPALQISIGEYK